MNKKLISYRAIIIGLFLTIVVFGFTTTALADGLNQPNYGDPITVDGDTSDWNLDLNGPDHFAVLYRLGNSNDVAEADAFLRYDSAGDVLYVLVLSRNGQNVLTINDQFVMVDLIGLTDGNYAVSQADAPPDGILPDLAWVNPNSGVTLTEGWEAAFVWNDAIDPEITEHEIFINSLVENGGIQKPFLAGGSIPFEILTLDYGDLSDSYGTLLSSNGPQHTAGTLRLGVQVDGESDGLPSDATLDDTTSRNDEDGVSAVGNWSSGIPTIQYIVNGCSGTCYLNAWVDWESDGEFNLDTDILFTNLPVINGTHYYDEFTVPEIDFPSSPSFFVRFRLCDETGVCDTPWSSSPSDAPFGEVEDYQWSFNPNAISLNSFTAASTQNSIASYVIVGFIAVVLFVGAMILLNKSRKQEIYS